MTFDNVAPWHETTILACLALGAMRYADPAPCFEAIRAICPEQEWESWEADVMAHRQRDLQSPSEPVVRDPDAWAAVAADAKASEPEWNR